MLLSWPYDLFILTEVRTPASAQRTLARIAASHNCSCLWSVVPPPSPTFSVSPGGIMIMARQPWQVRHFAIPALRKWEMLSRMVSGLVMGPSQEKLHVVALYGFAEGHLLRKNNEGMIQDALASLSSLTSPSLLAGDFNITRAASTSLSSALLRYSFPLTFIPNDDQDQGRC